SINLVGIETMRALFLTSVINGLVAPPILVLIVLLGSSREVMGRRVSGRVSSRGLIASVVSDAQRLVALEVALAKQEAKELATANAIALGVIAFGGLL